MRRPSTLVARFWKYVDRRGPDDCWPWLASLTKPNGYGRLMRSDGTIIRANRLALEIASGKPIPPGLMATHKCHQPWCCNPAHIKPGTAQDNTNDMMRAGRGRYQKRAAA